LGLRPFWLPQQLPNEDGQQKKLLLFGSIATVDILAGKNDVSFISMDYKRYHLGKF